jgi:hypothetical protein
MSAADMEGEAAPGAVAARPAAVSEDPQVDLSIHPSGIVPQLQVQSPLAAWVPLCRSLGSPQHLPTDKL